MNPLDDAWLEVSPYLDQALELEQAQRADWLSQLEGRLPAIAGEVRGYLLQLEELNARDFLGSNPAAIPHTARLAGQRMGAYTLEKVIGHGGMGTVWLARRSDGRFEGRAAVKLLNTALVGHPSERHFAREGSVLARLQHPNIAHLLDAGLVDGNQPYLVLEYVAGKRIDVYCDRHNLDTEQRIRLFLDVLGAVTHAHINFIVHRDIKPSNILVTEQGVVKLLDFGIASLLSSDSGNPLTLVTQHGPVGLTPGFAAPEQLRNEPITAATDVYSLGLVLLVLLAGRHPALEEGKTPAELIRLTLDSDMPRASEIATDPKRRQMLRGDLDNIIAMSLRRNPAERYSTVEQFAQDLRRYIAREPVSARAHTVGYLATSFFRRHWVSLAVATMIVTVVIGAVIGTTIQMAEAQRQRDHARFEARRAEAADDFLKLLMFSDLGPARPTRTFHERLELGVQMLDEQYRENDPLFAGHMLLELGGHFRENGETARANALYEQAYAIGLQHHDAELMATVQCVRAEGDASAGIGKDVVQRLDEALQLLSRLGQPDATLQAECLRARAIVQRQSGDISAAEALLRRALSVLESDGSTHRRIYVAVLNDLGFVYLNSNRPRDDLKLLQLAGAIEDRNGRGGTILRLATRHNIATALYSMGEIRAALTELEYVYKRWQVLEGGEPEDPIATRNRALLLVRMGQPQDTLQALRAALDRGRSTGHRTALAYVLLTLGFAYTDLGRWADAEAALSEAASLSADGVGGERSVRSQVEMLRARLDLAHGALDTARAHSEQSLRNAGYRSKDPDRTLTASLLTAARVALARQAPSDAEQFALDALAVAEPIARGPNTSADVGEALLLLANSHILAGKRADTKRLLERAVECLSNGLSPDHPLTIEARTRLEDLRTSLG